MSRSEIPLPAIDDVPGGRLSSRQVAIWLFCIAALVAAMVLLGGATRLTHSGLSMVEWRPLMGVLPPLGAEAWGAVFAKYQAFPEYQKINRGMSLGEFKAIFWFEYAHRLLGRVIGLAFLLPFLWFLWRRRIAPRHTLVFAGLFLLGGLQGLIGWWMVKSGLVDRPDVNHYRLAVHLTLALTIFALLLWSALENWRHGGADTVPRAAPAHLCRLAALALVLTFVQTITGALTAGLDAGLAYNSFPTMNGVWLPAELWALSPWWLNLVENTTTVQFIHRIGAALVVASVLALWYAGRNGRIAGRARHLLRLTVAAVALQFALGVFTLIYVVPVPLGVMHQAGALLLLTALVAAVHRLRRMNR